MTYVLAFFASFVFIGLKSWQQLNVVHKAYLWIVPTSMAMAVCEVWVIVNSAATGWGWIVLPIGLGSGLGSVTATFWHSKIVQKSGSADNHDLPER